MARLVVVGGEGSAELHTQSESIRPMVRGTSKIPQRGSCTSTSVRDLC